MFNGEKDRILIENLHIIKELFDVHGVRFWLDWGTLLGVVREGKIIEWDNDIDVGVFVNNFEKIYSIFQKIEQKGFYLVAPPLGKPAPSYLCFRRGGYGLDIHIYSELDKELLVEILYAYNKGQSARILYFFWQVLLYGDKTGMPINKFKLFIAFLIKYSVSLLPGNLKKIFSQRIGQIVSEICYYPTGRAVVPKFYFNKFRHIKVYDMDFLIPFNAEAYLAYKYGKDWKKPDKKWNWKEKALFNKCN